MKIAICEDEPSDLDTLTSLIRMYSKTKNIQIRYKSYSNASSLLDALKNEHFDLLFLDIFMHGINGMQTAHEIRRFNKHLNIVFLSVSTEFAVESYSVKAYTYIVKPITKEEMFSIFDEIITTMQNEHDCLMLKYKNGIIRIPYTKLSVMEVLGKTLSFHLSDGTIYEASATLSEYESIIFEHPEFMRVHRSFIVNLWHVKQLTTQEICTLNDKKVPVSRRLYPCVRDAYMKSLFTKKG